jgi:hypothetical protein
MNFQQNKTVQRRTEKRFYVEILAKITTCNEMKGQFFFQCLSCLNS